MAGLFTEFYLNSAVVAGALLYQLAGFNIGRGAYIMDGIELLERWSL